MRTYKARELVEDILKKKGLTKRELCRRIGIRDQDLNSCLKSNNPKYERLCELCNGMGVELCVIDGWRKYRLNEMVGNVDIDGMIDGMRSEIGSGQSEDRYGEQKEKIEEEKEKKREYAREYARKIETRERVRARNERIRSEQLEIKGDVCLHCAKCDERLERGFRHWCRGTQKYEARVRCKFFIQRDLARTHLNAPNLDEKDSDDKIPD